MPKQYKSMRDKFVSEGLSLNAAQSKAARIYNAKNPENPVTKEYDKQSARRTQRKRQSRKAKRS
jgi:hypothetical protein